MNIMRKLLSQGSVGNASSPTAETPTMTNPSNDQSSLTRSSSERITRRSHAATLSTSFSASQELSLSHFKKLLHDFQNPKHPLSDSEKESKLYMMLPIFCQIFAGPDGSHNPRDRGTHMPEIALIGDSKSFTRAVGRLLVTEVRRRATDQSAQSAAAAIAGFMEVENNGWLLLSAINVLSSEQMDDYCEVLTTVAVPSTLVKCLYLFFDLGDFHEQAENPSGICGSGDGAKPKDLDAQFTDKERRILLQKMFIQVLTRLSTYIPAVEELARKDDLNLLFSAVTSSCPKQNVMWRKTAADVLLTISRHSLTQPVISYLHNKCCLSLCISNMQKAKDLSPLEIVEMFVTVFCFLKDSSQHSETLLTDFKNCSGYNFLSDFLLSWEQKLNEEEEANEAIRNLVLLVASLSFCGVAELKMPPKDVTVSLYNMENFQMPVPENRDSTVRNIQAIRVLQTVFVKAQSERLTTSVLDAFSTIYSADSANYFLLEEQKILPQFAEKLISKPGRAQEKYFQLLDFLVQQLNFVPCKELMAVALMLKRSQNNEDMNFLVSDVHACHQVSFKGLNSILTYDTVFRDVFREVGMVEVYVGLLESLSQAEESADSILQEAGELCMKGMCQMLTGSNANANVFRDSGGSRVVLDLIKSGTDRQGALLVMSHLIWSGGCEDDMTALLELLHSTHVTDLDVKMDILQALIVCLRESHKARSVFRKCGGFVFIISFLVSLEGALADEPPNDWREVCERRILRMLRSVFTCLSVSMRFEPANARYFEVDMNCGQSLVETLRLLGCFSMETCLKNETKKPKDELQILLNDIFTVEDDVDHAQYVKVMPKSMCSALVVFRMLYDMSIDTLDRHVKRSSVLPSTSRKTDVSLRDTDKEIGGEKTTPTLNLTPSSPDPVIVHPGVVTTMFKLVPGFRRDDQPEISRAAQLFVVEAVKSLLRTEKNQQIMCDARFVTDVLLHASAILEDEAHILHQPIQYVLERLSAHKMEPLDLRTFLRIGNPLACVSDNERQKPGSFVPLTRVKTLVSMTTPKDMHHMQNASLLLPPFIEFDMSQEGFGCIFLPSLAPFSAASNSVVGPLSTQDSNVIGGIGTGDRSFPPQPGLTFSTWICIEKFSDPRNDPHPVRMLTITRQTRSTTEDPEPVACLSISLSARDKAIIVSTQEGPMSKWNDWQPDFSGDNGARIWFPDLIKEGEWHHVIVVLNRQALKNSSFSLFVNGQHIVTKRLNYINVLPGSLVGSTLPASSSSSPGSFSFPVQAIIGTPPQWRKISRLSWKQGPCCLFEDLTSPQLAALMHKLGPHYLGSLQAPQIASTGEVLTSQVAEERLVFNLNAVAVSSMTLAKIRKVYSRIDTRAIAKQLGMSVTENATPIRIVHNACGHLLGPARPLGGVIIGYLGVRVFAPQPVAKVIETVGGINVLLGIVAMARDTESLYAGTKALVCVLKSNPSARYEMEASRGYQTLAMLCRKKASLLNAHILYLILSLAGTIDPEGHRDTPFSGAIPNEAAFRDVVCDLRLWNGASPDLEKAVCEHFHELLADPNMSRNGSRIRIMREFELVDKLLSIVRKSSEPKIGLNSTLLNVIHALMCSSPRVKDVLCLALFTASTLDGATSDLPFQLNRDGTEIEDQVGSASEDQIKVLLRNRCLKLFHSLLHTSRRLHIKYCEDVVQIVGFDWVLLFLQSNLHATTVIWGLRILTTLLSVPTLFDKFRRGTCNGHWLLKSEVVLQNKMVQALGLPTSNNTRLPRLGIRRDVLTVPGFQVLNWLMPYHIELPETYFLIIAIALGQSVKELPENVKLDLDAVWNYIFGIPAADTSYSDIAEKVRLNGDSMITLLCMVRTMLNFESEEPERLPSWLREYPLTITQVLFYLYHNVTDFIPIFMTEEVLSSLVGTLFPYVKTSLEENIGDPKPEGSDLEKETECSSLSSHPAKRSIMNLMRILIVDSLSIQVAPKSSPVIDLLLDAKPECSTHSQQCLFQTELLGLIMDHLLAADVLIGDQAALPIAPGGSTQHVAPNVFYLASRIVDKLWLGIFKKDPDDVFQFTLKLISQAKRRNGGGALSLEGIYRCLDRTILYLLSRPHKDVISSVSVLEVLHKIMANRSIIFGAGNHELDFFGGLTFCLLKISDGLDISTDGATKTKWHVKSDDFASDTDDPVGLKEQSQNLLRTAAARVWDELYVCKRPALEEVFKVSFGSQNETPKLEAVRDNLHDPAAKVWSTYVDLERKGMYCKTPAWEFHSQLESRIQRITGGFTGGLRRLTSVTGGGGSLGSGGSGGNRKEDPPAKIVFSDIPQMDVEQAFMNHVSIVKEVVDLHYRNLAQTDEHMLKFIEDEWLQAEATLIQERGVWGPFHETPLTKWMLDMTEGPARRRQRLVRNDLFYRHYPYNERISNEDPSKPLKYKRPTSTDSKLWFEQHRNLAMLEREEDQRIVELEYDDCDVVVQDKPLTIDEQIQKIGFQGLKNVMVHHTESEERRSDAEDDDECDDEENKADQEQHDVRSSSSSSAPIISEPTSPTLVTEEESPDYQTVMRLLEEGEKISHMYRCARIQGLDTAEGILLFGKEHLYLLDGFTLVNGREVFDIDSLPPNRFKPIIPVVPGQTRLKAKRLVKKYPFDNIKEVLKRRYLLQPIAVEIFFVDGQNSLVAFHKSTRAKVYQRLLTAAPSMTDNAQQSVAGQRRSANVEQGSGILSTLMGETSVTHRWVRGELSNFQYLMALNTLAGRSYNDLMQYPVFPWVLVDYKSDELDLTNPSIFRDLSKPMGAQSEARLSQFLRRYEDWDDPHNNTMPYHYGTHYSSAMIVSSYLVRLEPFTQQFLHLQGGHFDLADRMFHSIEDAWESASKNNMADLRELIPEFFYLPEFLQNHNRFDLGTKQSGEKLDDVILPPWAKGHASEFIRVHREALESDYVSCHLHEWIDLIFGYKQQGAAAVDAVNVFHPLFYEGNVDVFNIEDPMERNATIAFINNFGQIPKQLFKKPHPARKLQRASSSADNNASIVPPSKVFFHQLMNLKPSMTPVKELKGPVGEIQCVDRVVYAVEQNKVLVPGNASRYLAWGFADQSFRLGNYESDRAIFVCEPNYSIGQVLSCVCPNSRLALTAGTSTAVHVYEYHKKMKQLVLKTTLYGHTEAVTCLAASPAWNIAVSGSRDRTAIVWDLSRYSYVKHLYGHVGPVSAVTVNDLTGDIVTCAGSTLYLWDINGRLQCSVDTATNPQSPSNQQQLLSVCCSQFNEWDRENVIMTGSSDGVVRMWSLDYVEVSEEEEKRKRNASISQESCDRERGTMSESVEMTHFAKKFSLTEAGERLNTLRAAIAHSRKREQTSDSEDENEDEEDDNSCRDRVANPEQDSKENTTHGNSSDEFVVVSQSDVDGSKRSSDGYTWTKRLVFRAKLTMHTAFERADNAEPAAVTALAISKDHKTIFIGDERGRVFSWSVSSKPGKGMVDHWCKDEGSEECLGCGVKFTIYERRHHCRSCGKLFCSSCSQYQSQIPKMKIMQRVRVCKQCFDTLKQIESKESK